MDTEPPPAAGHRGTAEPAWPDELVALYRTTYRHHVRTAYLLLGSRHEAEEVVHDAVVALRDKWPTVANPGAYLRTSVVNRSRGVLRRRVSADRFRPDPPPDDAPRQLVELRDVLLRLPFKQRAAIVLRYVHDLDDDRIAAELDCAPATVRSLVFRGLATVRTEVQR